MCTVNNVYIFDVYCTPSTDILMCTVHNCLHILMCIVHPVYRFDVYCTYIIHVLMCTENIVYLF